MNSGSRNIFEKFLQMNPELGRIKVALEPSYLPQRLPHREKEMERIAQILSPALNGIRPSNILIFGKPGVGKTSTMRFIERELTNIINSKYDTKVKVININCGINDNSYSILATMGNALLYSWEEKFPFTGWPMDKLFQSVLEKIENFGGIIILILDEVDKLIKKSGDSVLYQLLRINEVSSNGKISIIGISNDLKFMDYLDPRVKSRLQEETIVFHPYNATEIFDILKDRVIFAGIYDLIDEPVLRLAAAIGAQENGDARRAIDLLRVAYEISVIKKSNKITEEFIYEARDRLEQDVFREIISSLPLHNKVVLYSISILKNFKGNGKITSGECYELYGKAIKKIGLSPLTNRRVNDLISELDKMGIISSEVQSFGRYGRTTVIQLNYDPDLIIKLLETDEAMSSLATIKPDQKPLF